ncbi:zinc ribbon domain-containing protein [Halobacteriales archaeon QS_1_67_19]|nr:MAG: zinc ribbon domain-containing protein [Halobacteriales archaeon QS_1_67_19]
MDLAVRLLVALFVISTPTLLYLGLLRGLERLRDDALLLRLAESDDASREVSAAATRALDDRAVSADDRADRPDDPDSTDDALVCTNCGESNMPGARYCEGCLERLL